jgi:hypothetical protein
MIYEQAFYNLPEILVGARYLEQDFEAGITGAFAMAVLQELNGRNINNPISHIRMEHKYLSPPALARVRTIRVDMFLRTQAIGVANKLMDAYGWRFQNYLEAKFIKESSNQTVSRAELAVDLVRLAVLARAKPPGVDSVGRYLLHVYRGKPETLMGGPKTKTGKQKKNYQDWIDTLRKPGMSEITIDVGKDTAKAAFGKRFPAPINELKLTAMVRTIEIAPMWTVDGSQYWCYLTRIESFKCTAVGKSFEVKSDRTFVEGALGDRDHIWDKVYQHLDPPAPKKNR